MHLNQLAYFYWDPSPEMFPFALPLLGRSILWYGFFFALGFFIGYLILIHLLKQRLSKSVARLIAEKALVYAVLGTVIGARLGDILFYQGFSRVLREPFAVFKIWEGGLASHGGVVGLLIAFWWLSKRLRKKGINLTYLMVLDYVVIPAALIGFFIRIGNFFNQEILGTPTHVPWAVIFGHPVDGSFPQPRHPAQLYEAVTYLGIFVGLWCLWRFSALSRKAGKLTGVCLTAVFACRFCIEFFKQEQSQVLAASFLDMGQWLSLPLIVLGLLLSFARR